MNKIFLKIVSYFDPILEKTGVETKQLHAILRTKLLIDNRRPREMFNTRKKSEGKRGSSNQWLFTFTNILFGFFMAFTLMLNKMPYIGQTFYFIIFTVMMALTLITDFTTVLIDSRDQFILLPRPVNDRTIAISRILHISIYVLKIALLQTLPGLIFIGFIDGPLAIPLFFIQVIEATFISLFLVNIIYLLLLRAVSPQKFKDIISYFQIVFSILIFASYYLMPKLINVSVLQDVSLLSHWWAYLLPPVWIAALNELLMHTGRSGMITAILAIIGITAPLAGLWMVARVLAPGFNRRLAVIATSDGNSNSTENIKKASRISLLDKIANIIAPKPVENAGFRITWKLAARIREFKMRVYPAFAYMPIYFVVIILNHKGGNIADRFNNLQNSRSYIILIYMSIGALSAILLNVSQSEKYKGSWVYYALPIARPGEILSGMYKAVITLFYLPYFLAISAIVIGIWGPSAINDIILAFLISLTYGILLALFMVKGLPFSKPIVGKQSGGKAVTSIVILSFIGLIGYCHYLIMRWETAVWIALVPALLIAWTMAHYYKKQSWESIEMADI